MSTKEKFYQYWQMRNDCHSTPDRRELEDKMVDLLFEYARENYPNLTGDDLVTAIKWDFESDIIPRVVSEALDVEIETARRYRYIRGRGVIDTRAGRREHVPRRIRNKVEERDPTCVRCGVGDDLELHHIIPKKHGGVNKLENLAMLCEECHLEAHCGRYGEVGLAYDDIEDFWENFAG